MSVTLVLERESAVAPSLTAAAIFSSTHLGFAICLSPIRFVRYGVNLYVKFHIVKIKNVILRIFREAPPARGGEM